MRNSKGSRGRQPTGCTRGLAERGQNQTGRSLVGRGLAEVGEGEGGQGGCSGEGNGQGGRHRNQSSCKAVPGFAEGSEALHRRLGIRGCPDDGPWGLSHRKCRGGGKTAADTSHPAPTPACLAGFFVSFRVASSARAALRSLSTMSVPCHLPSCSLLSPVPPSSSPVSSPSCVSSAPPGPLSVSSLLSIDAPLPPPCMNPREDRMVTSFSLHSCKPGVLAAADQS